MVRISDNNRIMVIPDIHIVVDVDIYIVMPAVIDIDISVSRINIVIAPVTVVIIPVAIIDSTIISSGSGIITGSGRRPGIWRGRPVHVGS